MIFSHSLNIYINCKSNMCFTLQSQIPHGVSYSYNFSPASLAYISLHFGEYLH